MKEREYCKNTARDTIIMTGVEINKYHFFDKYNLLRVVLSVVVLCNRTD